MSRGGNWCIRGLQNGGRGRFGTLGWRLFGGGFLPSEQKRIINEITTMKNETVKDYLDFGILIVAVVSDGISSSALR
jgi:hypothetical protein